MRSKRIRGVMSIVVALACSIAGAGETNLARGKPYRLTPPPNYPYCTDPGDRVQLTDGVYTQGYFWTQPTTVGWRLAHPAIVTIDLQEVEPISGVSFNTAAGRAGVTWPEKIYVFVSDDGKTHHYLGDLVAWSRKQDRRPGPDYEVFRYEVRDLHTHGRYVTFMMVTDGPYSFVDEIEVFSGQSGDEETPPGSEVVTDLEQFFSQRQIVEMIRRRLRDDLTAIAPRLPEASQPQVKDLLAEIDTGDWPIDDDFRATLPLNDLHRRIFQLQAQCWRDQFRDPVVLWTTNRWDMLSPTDWPQKKPVSIEVAVMRGECRGEAINISNTRDEPVELSLTFEGLPGGSQPPFIDVHEVRFTDTRQGVPIAAAMPLAQRQGDQYRVRIPSGMTRQIWLNVHVTGLESGRYSGSLVMQPNGTAARKIPIQLKVYPFDFPEKTQLYVGGWDYTNVERGRDVTPENRLPLISHLRQRLVNTPWATSAAMPRGSYDDQGKLVEPPDAGNFRHWIELWPDAAMYCVFLSVGERFDRFTMGSEPFERAVTQWTQFWVDQLKQWKIEPSRLALLLVDEPHERRQDNIIIHYARVIQKTEPDIVIWEDPTWREPWQADPELFRVSDVLCPNLPMWIDEGERFAEFYLRQVEGPRTLWFYSCSSPGKLLDPYSYHRLQAWFAWRYGARGSCFWSFSDSGGASTWNDYRTLRGAFTPVFLDRESVTAGKHMEAIRESAEDFEYLVILRDRITAASADPTVEKKLLADARELLADAAVRVTEPINRREQHRWDVPKDRSIADAVRLEILDMLCRLEGMRAP